MSTPRQKVTEHILKHVGIIDPGGSNLNRYKNFLEAMSDKQFDQYMQDLRDKKVKFTLFTPNMKVVLKIKDILKAADSLKLNLFERLRLIDPVTKKKYLTKHEYLVVKLPVRRARQFLMHKLSVADSDKKLDALTGQVIKPDKASSFSFVEAQLLYSRGLSKTLEEFVKVRGGDIHAFSTFKQQLEETGGVQLTSIEDNTLPRSTVVMGTILKCMLLDNNLVEGM